MRQLPGYFSVIFAIAALLMVVSVGCVVLRFDETVANIATVTFAVGAIAFAGIQMAQTYDGNNFTIKRLRRILLFSDVCFIVAALLMIESNFRIVFPYVATTMDGYNNWVHYVHNNWVVALLIAAIVQMYATHRISYELKKEQ